MSGPHELTDAEVEELLGAYALDACEPDESRGDRSGARSAPRPRPRSRTTSRGRQRGSARPRRSNRRRGCGPTFSRRAHASGGRPVVDVYLVGIGRALPPRSRRFPTPRSTTSLPTASPRATWSSTWPRRRACSRRTSGCRRSTTSTRPTSRSAPRTLIDVFGDRPLDAAIDAWRDSVDANRRWAVAQRDDATRAGAGSTLSRARRDRRAGIRDVGPRRRPAPRGRAGRPCARRASPRVDVRPRGSVTRLSLALGGRLRPGKTARLVLTGDGGGDWLAGMGGGAPGAATT